MEELAGRHDFDRDLYEKSDGPGKALAIKILSQTKYFKSGVYRILTPKEDKKCGDVKIQFASDNSIRDYEVEYSGAARFDKNFKGGYDTVNVPDKNFQQIPDGYFMAVDGAESIHTMIPKRFYLIKVKHILQSEQQSNVNKFSDGKKEKFFKVPTRLVERYVWNDVDGKYEQFFP